MIKVVSQIQAKENTMVIMEVKIKMKSIIRQLKVQIQFIVKKYLKMKQF